jgi:hypothetical protein
MEYYRVISLQMATHLRGVVDNLLRTTWLVSSMLSLDPYVARRAATEFRLRLRSSTDLDRTTYESAFMADEVLMQQLNDFCDREVPCLLWRSKGQFQDIYRHIAISFASAPDHVVHCERMHAQWKWLETQKRALSLPMMNALLKLANYLFFNGSFPSNTELSPYIAIAANTLTAQIQLVRDGGSIAPGFTHKHILNDALNLSLADIEVVLNTAEHVVRRPLPSSPQLSWGFYLRWLFMSNGFYEFSRLSSEHVVFDAENKSFAGRETPPEEGLFGRPMSIAFFTVVERTGDGLIVRPMRAIDDGAALRLQSLNVAEMSRAAGDYIEPASATDTSRDMELQLEARMLHHQIMRYDSTLRPESDYPWTFELTNPTDIEEHYIKTRKPSELKKIELARQMQLREGLTNDARDELWKMSKDMSIHHGLLYDTRTTTCGTRNR